MKISRIILGVAFLAASATAAAMGPDPPNPERLLVDQQGPQNVRIHTDKTLRELQTYMQGVASQLGVRCDYCHNTDNFASDEKEHKRKARQFMQMVKDINEKYIPWEAPEGERHEIVCWNCHQGEQHPPHWPGTGR